MVNLDDLAQLGLDERGGLVAVAEIVAKGLARALLHQFLAVKRLGVHSHQVVRIRSPRWMLSTCAMGPRPWVA